MMTMVAVGPISGVTDRDGRCTQGPAAMPQWMPYFSVHGQDAELCRAMPHVRVLVTLVPLFDLLKKNTLFEKKMVVPKRGK